MKQSVQPKPAHESILKYDDVAVEELELDKTLDLSTADKLEYIDAQIDTMKATMWRSRVDLMLNYGIETFTDQEKIQVNNKILEHKNDIRRFSEALTLLVALRDELEK